MKKNITVLTDHELQDIINIAQKDAINCIKITNLKQAIKDIYDLKILYDEQNKRYRQKNG